MANALKKNVYHVDSIGTITVEAQQPVLYAILITPNAADSQVIIKESVSGTIVLDVRIATTESRYISFEAFRGIELRGSFEVTTLTNIDRCLLYGYFLAPTNQVRPNLGVL